jgi:hypothetical protein
MMQVEVVCFAAGDVLTARVVRPEKHLSGRLR